MEDDQMTPDLGERVWQELLKRCAATDPKHWDKVSNLVRVKRSDVAAAVKAATA